MVPEDRPEIVVFGLMLSGPFERMHYLSGFENSLCAFYESPDEVHAFLEAMEANRIATGSASRSEQNIYAPPGQTRTAGLFFPFSISGESSRI